MVGTDGDGVNGLTTEREQRIQQIRQRALLTTPGKWTFGWQANDWSDGDASVTAPGSGLICTITNKVDGLWCDGVYPPVFEIKRTHEHQEWNARFIADARDDVLWLLEQLEA